MPTVFREGGCRYFFFSSDGTEPRHIHVRCGGRTAKFWLDDVISLVYSFGFRQNEISEIRRIISRNRRRIEQKWDEYFSSESD